VEAKSGTPIMKRCPYCAEEIQDAAIVCKHCGRDLHGETAGHVSVHRGHKPRVWPKVLLGVVLAVPALALIAALLPERLTNTHDSSGACILRARVAATHENASVAPHVLAIRTDGSEHWRDVEVTVYGFGTGAVNDKRPTGPYRLKRSAMNGLEALNLADFENDDGSRWSPLTMHAAGVAIKARTRVR
jgi:hypothetical protein